MRELKFRVWSEEDREYRTDCDVFKLFHGKTGCPAIIYNDEGDRFDIEQYTGLKDKNNKDIYEGDIVSCAGFNTYAVIYTESRCAFVLYNDHHCVVLSFEQTKRLEVIGNIHENADLLEEE